MRQPTSRPTRRNHGRRPRIIGCGPVQSAASPHHHHVMVVTAVSGSCLHPACTRLAFIPKGEKAGIPRRGRDAPCVHLLAIAHHDISRRHQGVEAIRRRLDRASPAFPSRDRIDIASPVSGYGIAVAAVSHIGLSTRRRSRHNRNACPVCHRVAVAPRQYPLGSPGPTEKQPLRLAASRTLGGA